MQYEKSTTLKERNVKKMQHEKTILRWGFSKHFLPPVNGVKKLNL